MADKPKDRQQWIYDLLKLEPALTYNECFTKYLQSFTNSRQTFTKDWKIANERAKEYQIKANKAKDDISIAIELESVKSGLKSKLKRQLELQEMLEPEYRTKDVVGLFKGEVVYTERPLTPTEIKNIHIELSKMDGSYAPTKQEQTITDKRQGITDYEIE